MINTLKTLNKNISILALLLALVACGGGGEETPTPAPDMPAATPDQGSSAQDMTPGEDLGRPDQAEEADLSAPDQGADLGPEDQGPGEDMSSSGEGLTYHQDVKPILSEYCMRCHAPGGQGPLDFSTAENVALFGELIWSQVKAGEMPPPVAEPNCRDYQSSEQLVMREEDRETLRKWVEQGKKIGVDDGVPAAPPASAVFTGADLELRIPAVYTPTYGSTRNASNEYRCFALEHGKSEPFFITAMHPLVDQRAIVHHVVLAKRKRQNLDQAVFSPQGQDCIDDMSAIGGNGLEEGMIGAWAPGMEPIVFDGGGIRVNADDVLVLQMHYYSDRDETRGLTDHSGYAFKTAAQVRNPIFMAPLGIFDFNIPAGDADYSVSDSVSLDAPITLWGVFPHMHVLGKGYSMDVQLDSGKTCLLDGPKYDFNNQLTYIYKEPLLIPAKKEISFSCRWDNSAQNPDQINRPPTNVRYGERTNEEMCFAFSYVSLGAKR